MTKIHKQQVRISLQMYSNASWKLISPRMNAQPTLSTFEIAPDLSRSFPANTRDQRAILIHVSYMLK